ncbi:putative germin, rmlC-like cupin domain-containing protein [Rosa chinensis]|uniref:Germin-like protein n=2 Tax=Rosa chinensis TaxID=74649 RepID=A0A2P6SDG1_ROSCH|nr:putative germin, rmlC-like cupin domain-containing protein [Rosa chinensis]
MAMTMRLVQLLMMTILVLALATSKRVLASDPDILSDFLLPQNSSTVDASFFTFTGFRGIFDQAPKTLKTTKASMVEFPALNGQSVSYAVLQLPPQTLFPPHTRPDATGLLFLLDGSLEVGLIDTKNNLYTQKLQAGDMFVFPKGLIHYQYNTDSQLPATAIAAFGSASARAVAVPPSVFASGIDDVILAKSFKTDVDTIKKIKAGLTS